MIPILPKTKGLKERQISSFAGINKRDDAGENSFSYLSGADNPSGSMIETRSKFYAPALDYKIRSNHMLSMENEDGTVDIYYLGNGGFYKNGRLLSFNLYPYDVVRFPEFADFVGEDVEYSNDKYVWKGDFSRTKLIRYGKYIFAVPQMIYTDGEKTYLWNRSSMFTAQGSRIAFEYSMMNLTLVEAYRKLVFEGYKVGDVIEMYINGNKIEGTFTIKVNEKGKVGIECISEDGNILGRSDMKIELDNKFFIRHKNLPEFKDAAAVYNRMWGICDNRVYCSKLGHPFSFTESDGTASDAWWADTESSQDFTAISSLNGRIVALKPNSAYEIYGSVTPYTIKDVSRSLGCVDKNSLCEVNNILFLLTSEGISVYGGMKFVNIHRELYEYFEEAQAVNYGSKYFVFNGNSVYKYDYHNGLWTNITKIPLRGIASICGDVFGIRESGELIQLTGEKKSFFEYGDDLVSQWKIESVDVGGGDFYAEGINRIEMRFECVTAGNIIIEISRDGGEFQEYSNEEIAEGWQILAVPIYMKPCSHFKYRISGTGEIRLRLVKYYYRKGGKASKYE